MKTQAKAVAIAICSLIGLPASAQQVCEEYGLLRTVLAAEWGETPQASGLSTDGQLMLQVLANTETGSWTILVISTNGTACVTGSGVNYEATPTDPAPQGEAG